MGVEIGGNSLLDILTISGLVALAFFAAWRRETIKDLRRAIEAAEATTDAWKEERDAAVAKADRLEEDVADLRSRLSEAEATIKRLEERTDLGRYFEEQSRYFHQLDEGHKLIVTAIHDLETLITEGR